MTNSVKRGRVVSSARTRRRWLAGNSLLTAVENAVRKTQEMATNRTAWRGADSGSAWTDAAWTDAAQTVRLWAGAA